MDSVRPITALCHFDSLEKTLKDGAITLSLSTAAADALVLEDAKYREGLLNALVFQRGFDVCTEGVPPSAKELEKLIVVKFTPDEHSCSVSANINPELTHLMLKDYVEFLKDKRVLAGYSGQAIIDTFCKMRAGEVLPETVIATAKNPVPGKNATLVWDVQNVGGSAGQVDESGRIDFKSRNLVTMVTKGQEVAHKVHAVKGKDGFTVKGAVLPATINEDVSIHPGKNITTKASKDTDAYIAACDGCLVMVAGKMNVEPILEIKGNVDYSTGNVRMKGLVHISGGVFPGFIVDVDGDIMIDGYVEGGIVTATGSIVIRQGVKGQGHAKVTAGKTLTTTYAEFATLESAGDIIVENSVINSHITCGGKLIITHKKGAIIGGTVLATQGIEARTVGSDSNIVTQVEVGKDVALNKKFHDVCEEIQTATRKLKNLEMSFSKEWLEEHELHPDQDAEALRPEQKAAYNHWKDAKKTLHDLEAQRIELKKKVVTAVHAQIKVQDTVFPGTTLGVGLSTLTVNQEVKHSVFSENAELSEVLCAVLV
jgi:uncharacterized protein (DUF342 family)